jgi:hypothetical protein
VTEVIWIRLFPSESGAYRARDLLKSHGIDSVVADDSGLGMVATQPFIRGIRLGVRADDLKAALLILDTTRDDSNDATNGTNGTPNGVAQA